ALEGVSRLVAPTPREEAGAIALAFREVLETPGRTAMLVTPDRGLARRVAAEMRRWGVEIDDSAGRPLDRTPTGVMLRLVAEAAAQELAPVPLLSLLKHPLAGLGWDVATTRRNVRALERAVLRGVRPAPGLPGLHGALKGDPQHDGLLKVLESALQRFLTLLAAETVEITELLRAHVAAAEALATTDDVAGPDRLWAGEGGEAAAAFVADLAEAAPTLGPIAGRDYPALFEALMGGRVVRPRFGTHPRLTILGLLEARLQSADLMILGGLNEGTWPPEPAASPWMSRPMMAHFGLPLPERRIGLTAHDFVQAACAPRVMLTRAERVDGTPTVPSRWLVRLEALLDDAGRAAFDADPRLLHWLDRLDRPEGDPAPLPPPLPRPPVAARPRTLYVTHVETWVRDPYAFYAKHVLGLRTLDPVDQEPGPAQRGILVHDILGDFMQNTPDGTLEDLLAAGERAFAAQGDRPGLRAFWWPRFARAAKTLMDFEAAWRAEGWAPAVVEEEGSLALPDLAFTLKAKADRIDRKPDGTIAVMDYKTGQVPTKKAVETGLSPQLTLEAAIAREGQFPGLPKGTVAALLYLAMGGGKSAPVPGPLKLDPEAEADKALAGLKRMITRYDFEDTPYPSRPKVQFQFREGDYDHLARVREWGADGDGDDA
ncbi:MAG: double-strand break repair protein AddB, partial [Rhodobacterales bacterium]|nr:double-strand break repair protein AddB [Rhodobacterales bacterium]